MQPEETGNMIGFLRHIGWSGDQICNLILAVAGRVSADDAAGIHKELETSKSA